MQQFPVTGDSVGSWPFQMFLLLDNSEDCHCRFSILVIPRTFFSIDLIVPPASGVVHQGFSVPKEYQLCRVHILWNSCTTKT
ncbi:unnamed protein product [Rhodiola kirilowii]